MQHAGLSLRARATTYVVAGAVLLGFPTTGEGRIVGVGLMLGGIALVGTVTAALASWFVEQQRKEASK